MRCNCACPSLPSVTRVLIVKKDRDKGGAYFVEPPIALLALGGNLRIFNTTPEDSMFVLGSVRIPIKARDREDIKPFGSLGLGQYDYGIVMDIGKGKTERARGNSDPVIIIDKP